jgi:acetylornithine deacetylase/succinyl-diaminopimelate desuccinylase-like protein
MASLPLLKQWFEQHRSKLREDYFHFLRFKSISNDPAYAKDLRKCAEWLRDYIGGELIETDTYPLVYSEDLRAGPEAPTLLVYGHYDVMPADPLELWNSDPFEPTERKGNIYARGAVDDKGQIFYAILAAKALRDLGCKLSLNLKFCIEGEEESNSAGLIKALPLLKEKLKATSILVVDFSQFDRETPAVTLGARGLLALEVTLTGSTCDLHSGSHGGLAYNPNKALVKLLSQLWDENERVQVKGFYDDILEPTEEEKGEFLYEFNKTEYTKEFGVEAFGNEIGFTLRS